MNEAQERISAACPKSEFKDDRHAWGTVAHNGTSLLCDRAPQYYMKRCHKCRLVVVMSSTYSAYDDAPRRADVIHAAFYEPETT